jgi:hypothetical protein
MLDETIVNQWKQECMIHCPFEGTAQLKNFINGLLNHCHKNVNNDEQKNIFMDMLLNGSNFTSKNKDVMIPYIMTITDTKSYINCKKIFKEFKDLGNSKRETLVGLLKEHVKKQIKEDLFKKRLKIQTKTQKDTLKEVEDLNKEIAILKNSSVREIAIIKKLKSENHELKTNNSYILQQFKDQTKDLEFKNKELIYKNKELEQLKSFHINEIKFMEYKLTHALEK